MELHEIVLNCAESCEISSFRRTSSHSSSSSGISCSSSCTFSFSRVLLTRSSSLLRVKTYSSCSPRLPEWRHTHQASPTEVLPSRRRVSNICSAIDILQTSTKASGELPTEVQGSDVLAAVVCYPE